MTAHEAKVRVKGLTEKLKGDRPFKDNITEMLHTLKKFEGEWRICQSDMEKIQYITSTQATPLDQMESRDIIEVLEANAAAMKSENLNSVLATISKQCGAYETSKKMLVQLFETYDLEPTILERTILSIRGDEATVREKIRMKKRKGAAPFRDNESTTISTLIKEKSDTQSIWKICSTEIKDIVFLK